MYGKGDSNILLFMKAEHIEYTADGEISIIQGTILRREKLIFEPLLVYPLFDIYSEKISIFY